MFTPLALGAGALGAMYPTKILNDTMRGITPAMGRAFENIKPDLPELSPAEKQRLSNQELLEKIRQRIYQDQAQLGNEGYKPYPGRKAAPMSAMTQNARALRDTKMRKPAPYSGKVRDVLGRQSQGFTPEQIRQLSDYLARGTTSEDLVTNRLHKTFDNNFGYERDRERRIGGKINRDLNKDLAMSEYNLGNLNNDLTQLEETNKLQNAGALQRAGLFKEGRREDLTKQLEEFGNQQHAFDNLSDRGKRDAFDEEVMAPYRKINMANRALEGINPEEDHPDKLKVENQLLQKINNTYNTPYSPYPGQRVVGLDADTAASYALANQISPKYRDTYYDDKKAIEREMLGGDNVATKLTNNVPANLEPLMGNLDNLAKKQLKRETKRIASKYIKSGTYGSGVHKAELEQNLRDVMRKVQAEREGALVGGIKDEAKNIRKTSQNQTTQYNLMNEMGAKEFSDILRANEALNKRGNTKWGNKQAQEDESIGNWYREQAQEWAPFNQYYQSLGRGQGSALGQQTALAPWESLAKGYNTDLKTLFSTPQIFDENNKALNEFDEDWKKRIRNQGDYYNNVEAERAKQAQLEAERNRLAQLERERQEALRRQPAITAPQQPTGMANRMLQKRQDAWDYFDWSRNLATGAIPLPPSVPRNSSLGTGGVPYYIAKQVGQPTFNSVTQPDFFNAYDKHPNNFMMSAPQHWRREYGVS